MLERKTRIRKACAHAGSRSGERPGASAAGDSAGLTTTPKNSPARAVGASILPTTSCSGRMSPTGSSAFLGTCRSPMTSFWRPSIPKTGTLVDGRWRSALRGAPYDIEHRIVVGGAVKWVRERAELSLTARAGSSVRSGLCRTSPSGDWPRRLAGKTRTDLRAPWVPSGACKRSSDETPGWSSSLGPSRRLFSFWLLIGLAPPSRYLGIPGAATAPHRGDRRYHGGAATGSSRGLRRGGGLLHSTHRLRSLCHLARHSHLRRAVGAGRSHSRPCRKPGAAEGRSAREASRTDAERTGGPGGFTLGGQRRPAISS